MNLSFKLKKDDKYEVTFAVKDGHYYKYVGTKDERLVNEVTDPFWEMFMDVADHIKDSWSIEDVIKS